MVGQGVILSGGEAELRALLDKSGMPAASTLLGLSALPTDSPQYVGMLGMHGNYGPNIKNRDCDLLLAVGMRFDDRVTGNPGISAPTPSDPPRDRSRGDRQDHPGRRCGRGRCETAPFRSSPGAYKPAATGHGSTNSAPATRSNTKKVIRKAVHPAEGRIRMGEAVDAVARAYRNDAVMVTDVGQQQMNAARYFGFRRTRSVVTSGGLGTMGFGLPAAIGAKLGAPDREVSSSSATAACK